MPSDPSTAAERQPPRGGPYAEIAPKLDAITQEVLGASSRSRRSSRNTARTRCRST
jgi:hypothetical protein